MRSLSIATFFCLLLCALATFYGGYNYPVSYISNHAHPERTYQYIRPAKTYQYIRPAKTYQYVRPVIAKPVTYRYTYPQTYKVPYPAVKTYSYPVRTYNPTVTYVKKVYAEPSYGNIGYINYPRKYYSHY